MKRVIDIFGASCGLLLLAPVLLPTMLAIWLQDYCSPFYIAPRIGKGQKPFRMIKLRSMVLNADKSGVSSTAVTDRRITPVGQFVRRYKLDEIPQLWNVLVGEMSLVGPRPNVAAETSLYTAVENKLLTVRPGITDFSSIVFADEGEILRESPDPDRDYNQLIRPGKSRLGIFYIEQQTVALDVLLIALTVLAIVSRRRALDAVATLLERQGAPADLVRIARRCDQLTPALPPGALPSETLKEVAAG